jgi:hypothetical protein
MDAAGFNLWSSSHREQIARSPATTGSMTAATLGDALTLGAGVPLP